MIGKRITMFFWLVDWKEYNTTYNSFFSFCLQEKDSKRTEQSKSHDVAVKITSSDTFSVLF